MIERTRGAIINVVSIAGHNGGRSRCGHLRLVQGRAHVVHQALAKELAPQGVRVNAVSPGVIDTPFHEVFSTPEMIQNFVKMIPLGRVGTPAARRHRVIVVRSACIATRRELMCVSAERIQS